MELTLVEKQSQTHCSGVFRLLVKFVAGGTTSRNGRD